MTSATSQSSISGNHSTGARVEPPLVLPMIQADIWMTPKGSDISWPLGEASPHADRPGSTSTPCSASGNTHLQ